MTPFIHVHSDSVCFNISSTVKIKSVTNKIGTGHWNIFISSTVPPRLLLKSLATRSDVTVSFHFQGMRFEKQLESQ